MKELEPHQTRVIKEKEALDKKINALYHFTKTETYNKLDLDNRVLLSSQLDAMRHYSTALNGRIILF